MSNATEMNRNPRAGVNARWGLCQRLRDGSELDKIGATLKAVATADVAVCDAGICP